MGDAYISSEEVAALMPGAVALGECDGDRESKWTGWRAYRAADGRVFVLVTEPNGDDMDFGHLTTVERLPHYGIQPAAAKET